MDFDKVKYSLDDLLIDNVKMFQLRDRFRFGVDSVLLANFAASYIKKGSRMIDLCSGCGVVPLLLSKKVENPSITAVEIDKDSCETLRMSLRYNHLEDRIHIINTNLLDLASSLFGSFDALTINPPYIAKGKGLANESKALLLARSEQTASLEEMLGISSKLLRDKGNFFMVHKTNRLGEIIQKMDRVNLKVKTLRFIHSFPNKPSSLVLIRASRNGGEFLDVLPPLVIYEKENEYTKEVLDIYGKV